MLAYGIQEHDATRAGLHYDLTLQDPKNKKNGAEPGKPAIYFVME